MCVNCLCAATRIGGGGRGTLIVCCVTSDGDEERGTPKVNSGLHGYRNRTLSSALTGFCKLHCGCVCQTDRGLVSCAVSLTAWASICLFLNGAP